jgi:hypothetical protein
MLINHSTPTYCRPMFSSSMRRQVCQKVIALIGPKVLWVAVGKVLLLFFPLLFLVNFWLSSSAERNAVIIQTAGEGRYVLMDENIKLRAERARLYSPEYLNTIAAKQLALYVPEKGQITRF